MFLGRCAFEPNYCGEGTCATDITGKHFCVCKSGQFGLACELREPAGELFIYHMELTFFS